MGRPRRAGALRRPMMAPRHTTLLLLLLVLLPFALVHLLRRSATAAAASAPVRVPVRVHYEGDMQAHLPETRRNAHTRASTVTQDHRALQLPPEGGGADPQPQARHLRPRPGKAIGGPIDIDNRGFAEFKECVRELRVQVTKGAGVRRLSFTHIG